MPGLFSQIKNYLTGDGLYEDSEFTNPGSKFIDALGGAPALRRQQYDANQEQAYRAERIEAAQFANDNALREQERNNAFTDVVGQVMDEWHNPHIIPDRYADGAMTNRRQLVRSAIPEGHPHENYLWSRLPEINTELNRQSVMEAKQDYADIQRRVASMKAVAPDIEESDKQARERNQAKIDELSEQGEAIAAHIRGIEDQETSARKHYHPQEGTFEHITDEYGRLPQHQELLQPPTAKKGGTGGTDGEGTRKLQSEIIPVPDQFGFPQDTPYGFNPNTNDYEESTGLPSLARYYDAGTGKPVNLDDRPNGTGVIADPDQSFEAVRPKILEQVIDGRQEDLFAAFEGGLGLFGPKGENNEKLATIAVLQGFSDELRVQLFNSFLERTGDPIDKAGSVISDIFAGGRSNPQSTYFYSAPLAYYSGSLNKAVQKAHTEVEAHGRRINMTQQQLAEAKSQISNDIYEKYGAKINMPRKDLADFALIAGGTFASKNGQNPRIWNSDNQIYAALSLLYNYANVTRTSGQRLLDSLDESGLISKQELSKAKENYNSFEAEAKLTEAQWRNPNLPLDMNAARNRKLTVTDGETGKRFPHALLLPSILPGKPGYARIDVIPNAVKPPILVQDLGVRHFIYSRDLPNADNGFFLTDKEYETMWRNYSRMSNGEEVSLYDIFPEHVLATMGAY